MEGKLTKPKPADLKYVNIGFTDGDYRRIKQHMKSEGIAKVATAVRSLVHKALKAMGV